MVQMIDITGQRFGRLVALEYMDRSQWRCLCDCGNETTSQGEHLRAGRTKSCGCLSRERLAQGRQAKRKHWLVGQVFDALTVKAWDNAHTKWECQCVS